jgi:hypothetical protein
MSNLSSLDASALTWLLEPDPANPGVRYFALAGLLDRPAGDPELVTARQGVMSSGPVPAILDAQFPEGYWNHPGNAYAPKYRGTNWSVIFLAMLGAEPADKGVRAGGGYLLEHSRAASGRFRFTGSAASNVMVHCLEGNLCAALLDLGWLGDPRLDEALEGMARSVTGLGMAPAEDRQAPVRFYRSGNSGPGFLCSANNHLPCAWGAVKVLLALGKVPPESRTPAVTSATIAATGDFLLGRDPAVADYPTPFGGKPNGSWFKFGYPLGYVTDVLQNLEALAAAGFGADPRMASGLDLVRRKQDAKGRWKMEYTYNGKMWADVETLGQPSKWVTLRALRVLKRAGQITIPAGFAG